MQFVSPLGEERYDAFVAAAAGAIIALDFDGTLAPIVDDPTKARIHPDAAQVLLGLAPRVLAIAVVTGRPARQVLDLGGLEDVADELAAAGTELYVFGQYGNERWSSSRRAIVGPRPPHGLATFLRELPRTLRLAGAGEAYVEEKGLAVAVHTRRLSDPEAAFQALLSPLTGLASAHDLVVEPGRQVIEVRSDGMDKGLVVERLIHALDAKAFLFAGDDLGDVEAFDTVAAYAKEGMPTLLVASASSEESVLVPLADVVVRGPAGVLDLLRRITADAS
ncbi:trehalose-phosphatase [Nocardioides sp.]|uniref:trehalose-phosphatase n=1 Tax=Nocardioides sp. TaxID=35761 RepID=UPI0039E402B8